MIWKKLVKCYLRIKTRFYILSSVFCILYSVFSIIQINPMPNPEISLQTQNNIATITFFHPKGNSFPGEQLRKLAGMISDVGKAKDSRVIVLKSKGDGAFCAGASFDELISIKNFEEGKHFFMGFAMVINAMRRCPKLIIARVQGKTVGGGVGLAAAADYTLASEAASVKLSELALGIGPFVVGPVVERKIGISAYAALSINAQNWQSAQWAKEHGLFNDIFKTPGQLDEAVSNLAKSLAESSPDAMHELKNILWEGTAHWDALLERRAEVSGRLVLSEYTREFIRNFKSKES